MLNKKSEIHLVQPGYYVSIVSKGLDDDVPRKKFYMIDSVHGYNILATNIHTGETSRIDKLFFNENDQVFTTYEEMNSTYPEYFL